jgi:hypothetical protein
MHPEAFWLDDAASPQAAAAPAGTGG